MTIHLHRFERLIRLVGPDGFAKLKNSHVMIIGIGGVGSWAAEALARSAIGKITLIDFDKVALSNTNRQLTCADSTIGRDKCRVMQRRLQNINPESEINALPWAYTPDTSEDIFKIKPDIILDAIDNITYKCHLLANAKKLGFPIITSTGAAGRFDPTMVKVTDLSHTKVDPMATQVRKKLRKDYGYPGKRSFHIPAVYSEELPLSPYMLELPELNKAFENTNCPKDSKFTPDYEDEDAFDLGFIEDTDNSVLPEDKRPCRKAPPCGTISFVTGTFGLVAASLITKHILGQS